MTKNRLEAFSDGVLAIIITIMVLEMKAPHDANLEALGSVLPEFLSYVMSFLYVAIYWNNHHHIFHEVKHINAAILWANLHLLFWLSLIPFVTSWMGRTHFATWPVACYGVVLLMSAFAWELMRRALLRSHDRESTLVKALGGKRSVKELASLLLYFLAVGLAFIKTWAACGLYALVAMIWLIPDRRIAREIERTEQ